MIALEGLDGLVTRIEAMSPSDQLRFAAEILEEVRAGRAAPGQLMVAAAVVDRVHAELVVMLVSKGPARGG